MIGPVQRADADANETLLGELERIGSKIDQNLLNARVIAYQHIRRVHRNALREAQMSALGLRLEKSGQTIHQNVQIERRPFYDYLSRLDLAKIKQVVDKRAKLPR